MNLFVSSAFRRFGHATLRNWKATKFLSSVDGGHGGGSSYYQGALNRRQQPQLVKPELVIFDKDGTLICFQTMAWWIEKFVDRLHQETGVSVNGIYSLLHYDTVTGKCSNDSVVARCTNQQVKDLVAEYLRDEKVPSFTTTSRLVDDVFKEIVIDQSPHASIVSKPLGDVKKLFHNLTSSDVKVAVCTSDCRAGTLDALTHLEIINSVSMVVCGDDVTSVPKPDPTNALGICSALDIHPSRTCIIGDTTADVIMGQRANLGSVLGVLSGVGKHEDLSPYADDILNDIHHITSYFNL